MDTSRNTFVVFILFQLVPYFLAGVCGRPINSTTQAISSFSSQNARPDNTKVQAQFGVTQKFCNMFGCDCTPPKGAICCEGYSFDRHSRKCRQML
ncbi:hypothetical protein HNY73_013718 [Argiope bruennichi]|uniref:Uncharacterized protein n=1 Tax=Argiope bruennichi TaxID=94029 RepID=A0A8T0ELP9_ARGBR|nr:hypothetical protein HNY73_013718 [Argiope bruennichi]